MDFNTSQKLYSVPNDKMVASLTMGIWTKLFSKKRYKRGGKTLLQIFPNKQKGKNQIQPLLASTTSWYASITLSENIICWLGGTDYGHIVVLHIAKSRIHKIEDNPQLWFELSFNDLNPKDL